ncbi:MAG TPA: RecQ family ATP-dependent DNA helicase [Clostridia bacterium]|nr:RecQ family ATP-dependent DNA helicase [Clostridia bacterium]
MDTLTHKLNSVFGISAFRPAQREVIQDLLAGHDVVCVMPTGAGKSLCFQLPAVVTGGLTIIISPLISLMADQSAQLRRLNIPALVLNSSQSGDEQRSALSALHRGFTGLLYIAPERFSAPSFQSLLPKLQPKLFAVDEAHCISSWGHDFRPEYARLGEMRRQLGSARTIALTATATPLVRDDIIRQLGLKSPRIHITGFDRPNLAYTCQRLEDAGTRNNELVNFLRKNTGSGIVYCATRKAVELVTTLISNRIPSRPVFSYHAGMDQSARSSNHKRFMEGAGAIAVATNAFGMGINKPDIRFVVHYNMPGTVEAYYQEAGRAGRDGNPSECMLLYSASDRRTQEFFIDKIGDNNDALSPRALALLKDHARKKLAAMTSYVFSARCRRKGILDYFGDKTSEVTNCACDNCASARRLATATAIAAPETMATPRLPREDVLTIRKILSAVQQIERRGAMGVHIVADVLVGSKNRKLQDLELDQLPAYAALQDYKQDEVVRLLNALVEERLVNRRGANGNAMRPVVTLSATGIAVTGGHAEPPSSLARALHRPQTSVPSTKPTQHSYTAKTAPQSAKRDTVYEPLDNEYFDGNEDARFGRLRRVRAELAKKAGRPAFLILHDSTLREIARVAPRNMTALAKVKGLGPIKLEMFGSDLLRALSDDEAG